MSLSLSLLDQDSIEERRYQKEIFKEIKDKNSLVVLPTGLGKTVIAVYLICDVLEKKEKVVMMAPSRPLCGQHRDLLLDITEIEDEEVVLVTGELYTPRERENIWREDHKVYIATPQVINNDLHDLPISSIGLMIFDEAHRATGDYAYGEIAKACRDKIQYLGMTASPGNSFETLVEICYNLNIEHIEVREETDEDVSPYLSDRDIEWIEIEKSEPVRELETLLDSMLHDLFSDLSDYSKRASDLKVQNIGKSVLIDIQKELQKRIKKENSGYLFHALSLTSACIKLSHLKELILTQGIDAAHNYHLELLEDESRSAKYITKKDGFDELGDKLLDLKVMPIETDPKLEETRKILRDSSGNVIVFAQYRDTVEYLVNELSRMESVYPKRLIGQADRANEGMSQEEQKETLKDFKESETNVLVSTSIGEEGLDIPSTESVIFYEAVPSAIRYIQRKGRTARNNRPGKVYVLLTKDSKDEVFHWKSVNEEKRVYEHVNELKMKLEQTDDSRKVLEELMKETDQVQITLKDHF